MIPLLRPTKIRHYLKVMEQRGHATAAVLAGSAIEQGRLTDPSYFVDAEQYEAVIKNMIRLSGNPALGLDIGGSVELVDFGILAHAMMSSSTLRQAVQLWQRYQNLVGMTHQLSVEEHPQHWVSVIDSMGMTGVVKQFCVEESLMHAMKLGPALTGVAFRTLDCDIHYPAPGHAELYEERFGCAVRFNAPRTGLSIASPGLDIALRGNDPELHEICLRHCGQIMRDLVGSNPVLAQLRALFLSRPKHLPSLEESAAHVGMNARTLRRHLQEAGTSYQQLLNDYRLGLAKEYLQSRQLTAKEVSFLLGFADIAAFRRAFKSWTGQTVGQYMGERDADSFVQDV